MSKRYISGITALLLAFSAASGILNSDLSLIYAEDIEKVEDVKDTEDTENTILKDIRISGDTDHFKYDLFIQHGNAKYDYNPEENPRKASFSDYHEADFEFKKEYSDPLQWKDYDEITVEYEADLSVIEEGENLFYAGIHGYFNSPYTHIYIIDAWAGYKELMDNYYIGSYISGGVTYDLYHNIRTDSNRYQIDEYWAFRRDNLLDENNTANIEVRINLTDHISNFAKYDTSRNNYLMNGKIESIGYNVNAYESGKIDINLNGILISAHGSSETGTKPTEKYKSFKDITSGKFASEGVIRPGFKEAEGRFIAENFEIVKSESDISVNSNLSDVSASDSSEDDGISSFRYVLSPETERIIEFANKNNLKFDAGTLIDVRKFPAAFFKDSEGNELSREALEQRLETLIESAFKELSPAKLDTIDIYCEPIFWNDSNSSFDYWESVYGDESFIEDIFRLCRKYAPEGCRINYRVPDFYHSDMEFLKSFLTRSEDIIKNYADGVSIGFDCPSFSIGKEKNLALHKDGYKYTIGYFIEKGINVRISDIKYIYSYFADEKEMYTDLFAFYSKHNDGISEVVINTDTRKILYTDDYVPFRIIMNSVEHAIKYGEADILGDADRNGVLNSSDLVTLISMMTSAVTAEIPAACDIDNDGKYTVADLILLKCRLMS